MYGELTYHAGLYVEGDANVLGRWSGRAILASAEISDSTKASVERQYEDNTRQARERLAEWESGTSSLDDSHGDWMWEGIHVRIADEFGPEYLQRYVRAWRRDNMVRDLLVGPNPSGSWWERITLSQRATFRAAAFSAAVRTDLRARFLAWRFPVEDALFQKLYQYMVVAMEKPL